MRVVEGNISLEKDSQTMVVILNSCTSFLLSFILNNTVILNFCFSCHCDCEF